MAESKGHTPGPWKFRTVYDHEKCQRIALLLETTMADPPMNDPCILAVREDWIRYLLDTDEGRHRMTLLASAPALLEALEGSRKAIADILDNCPYFFPARGIAANLTPEQAAWRKKAQGANDAIRAALASARGDA